MALSPALRWAGCRAGIPVTASGQVDQLCGRESHEGLTQDTHFQHWTRLAHFAPQARLAHTVRSRCIGVHGLLAVLAVVATHLESGLVARGCSQVGHTGYARVWSGSSSELVATGGVPGASLGSCTSRITLAIVPALAIRHTSSSIVDGARGELRAGRPQRHVPGRRELRSRPCTAQSSWLHGRGLFDTRSVSIIGKCNGHLLKSKRGN